VEFEDDGTTIIEPENTAGSFNKEQQFSHSYLMLITSERCLRLASKELVKGYTNEKVDRFGNITRSYVPDTRLEYIGSIKAFDKLLKPVYSPKNPRTNVRNEIKELGEEISKLKYKLNSIKEEMLMLEAKDWAECPKSIRETRIKEGIMWRKNNLSKGLHYHNQLVEEQVEIYELIFEKLMEVAYISTKKSSGDDTSNFEATEIDYK
jgi:hypothetical protein